MAVCDPSVIPQPNMTELTVCREAMATFDSYTSECSKLSGAAACSCWSNDSIAAELDVIKKCDLSQQNKMVVKAVSDCKAAFGKCRKYEDEVANAIHACNQDSTDLKSNMKILTDNKAAVTSLLTQVQTLTGSSTRSVLTWEGRSTITTCADFTTAVNSVLTLTSQTTSSCDITTLASSATSASVTCTAAEITALEATETLLSAAIVTLTEELAVITATLTGECE